MKSYGDIAFTPAVLALQEANGSRQAYARRQDEGGPEGLSFDEKQFLEAADSFYLASVSETGWPYVQHRGGPAGFLKVILPATLAFADFGGNRQYISAGNVSRDDRVALFVMDPVQRQRLKLLGRLRFEPIEKADPGLRELVDLPGYRARVERIALIEIEAFDWNCSQHITQRFTRAQVQAMAQPLKDRIVELESEIQRLRQGGAGKL